MFLHLILNHLPDYFLEELLVVDEKEEVQLTTVVVLEVLSLFLFLQTVPLGQELEFVQNLVAHEQVDYLQEVLPVGHQQHLGALKFFVLLRLVLENELTVELDVDYQVVLKYIAQAHIVLLHFSILGLEFLDGEDVVAHHKEVAGVEFLEFCLWNDDSVFLHFQSLDVRSVLQELANFNGSVGLVLRSLVHTAQVSTPVNTLSRSQLVLVHWSSVEVFLIV